MRLTFVPFGTRLVSAAAPIRVEGAEVAGVQRHWPRDAVTLHGRGEADVRRAEGARASSNHRNTSSIVKSPVRLAGRPIRSLALPGVSVYWCASIFSEPMFWATMP